MLAKIKTAKISLAILANMNNVYQKNSLDSYTPKEVVEDPSAYPVYQGRGGGTLISIQNLIDAGKADLASNEALSDIELNLLEKLATIWMRYMSNDLDDEARRYWGKDGEERQYNKNSPESIILVATKGGSSLLTLQDTHNAYTAYLGYLVTVHKSTLAPDAPEKNQGQLAI